jgi:predicted nucleic-acid-binding protein
VRAADTNILARYYLQDDAQQASLARGLIEDGDLFVPKTVLLELEWVLRSVANQPRAKVLACLKHLTSLPGITVEDHLQVDAALEAAERGVDFADALHHAASVECEVMLTFDDRAFARRAAKLQMIPPVQIPGKRRP